MVSVAPPAEPRGEKKLFFFQISFEPGFGAYRRRTNGATTNVQNRFVQFVLLPFLLFCSP